MRLRELIRENTEDNNSAGPDDTASSPTHDTKPGKKGDIHPHHKSTIKGMTTYPEYPGYYYNMYRFGVNMAGNQHGDHNMDQHGPHANQMITLAYTDGDKKIIKQSMKNMGIKGQVVTADDSLEPDDTNNTSPVAKSKRNKYGI